MIKKTAIIGKGGVGLLYGGIIERALGHDAVEYVMDDARYKRHAGDAYRINGEARDFTTVPASEATPVDIVILTVKATGLDMALDTMEALVGPNTRIISLLNGIRSEELIAERFGWERTVRAVCQGMDAVFFGTELTYTHAGQICFGAARDAEGRALTGDGVVEDIGNLLCRAGIDHVVEDDALKRQWTKLMLNVGVNQTCMAFGGTYGSVSAPGEQNRTFIAAMREVIAVAGIEGVALTEVDLSSMAALIAGLDPAGMPSMALDRIARRRSEVAEFAGTIVERAERAGILVPTNRWLLARIHEIEATY